MPYIAFDLDALSRVPDAARAAGLAEDALGYGLLRLWSWCFKEKVDAVGAPHLAGFFGTDGDKVATALVAFRFLDLATTGGFRVRGAERYLRVRKAQSEAGKAKTANLLKGNKPEVQPEVVPGSPPGLSPAPSRVDPELSREDTSGSAPALHRAPSTEHRIDQTQHPSDAGADAPTAVDEQPFKLTGDPIPKARRKSDAEKFYEHCQGERTRVTGLVNEGKPEQPKLNTWFLEAIQEVGLDRLWQGYARYVLKPRDTHWVDRGFPFNAYMAKWREYVPPEVTREAGAN